MAEQLFAQLLSTLRATAVSFLRLDIMSTGYAIALKLATRSTVARDCDIVLQSPASNVNCWLKLSADCHHRKILRLILISCDWILLPLRRRFSLASADIAFAQLLIMMTSSLLLIASSRIYADVILADNSSC
ncbi:hypothetical protein F511_02670 [Dorcoceras hygrometricum]|uniref:Uncharacterized protein n=1 Tax=Dorcoceras hygrometricum TaxID=472368 RepID=A0A2Z7DBK0_9LAMI|nr:hypothetical protein F511_02670 [Dorcoceras hygrometricum]